MTTWSRCDVYAHPVIDVSVRDLSLVQRQEGRLEAWQDRQDAFQSRWGEIKTTRRVEIHIPSVSSTFNIRQRVTNRRVKEGSQLSRLCAVEDPLVEVLYVSPVVLPETVLAYYKKLIEVSHVLLFGGVAA